MATIKTAIVTSVDAGLVRKSEYRGNVQRIPIFVDASEALVNNGDVITLTAPLPQNCRGLALALNHDGANGLAASSTLAITVDSVVQTVTATIPTSTDTNSEYIVHCLKNLDISGGTMIATVGGADWADTVDLYGYIDIVTDE